MMGRGAVMEEVKAMFLLTKCFLRDGKKREGKREGFILDSLKFTSVNSIIHL